jgi:hypothetical protein
VAATICLSGGARLHMCWALASVMLAPLGSRAEHGRGGTRGVGNPAHQPCHHPSCMYVLQTDANAGPEATCLVLPSSGRTTTVYVRACMHACMQQQQQQQQRPLGGGGSRLSELQTNPLHHTQPSRQNMLVGAFFHSRAIPLLASEAYLYYIHITIASRGSLSFYNDSFLGNRLAHDWPCLRI